jgi:hypothetical protein
MEDIRRQSFTGLFRFTLRIWRANLALLVAVALAAGALSLLAPALIEGLHSSFSFSGVEFGVLVHRSDGGTHLSLSLPMLATGLIAIAASSWTMATMIAVLLLYFGLGRRAGVRELGCGLPFWPWVAAIVLLEESLDRGVHLIGSLWPVLTPFTGLAGFAITTLFVTVFTFYAQEIVASGRDGFAALAESWRLVARTGVWRVLGNELLFFVCLLPVLFPEVALVAHFGAHSVAGAASSQLLTVVLTPLMASFTTVMYLLACGERAKLERLLGPDRLSQEQALTR